MTSELGIRRTDNLIKETHEASSESQTLPRGVMPSALKKNRWHFYPPPKKPLLTYLHIRAKLEVPVEYLVIPKGKERTWRDR